MRLELLGGFVLRLDGVEARQPPHVQRLLAFLALQRRPLQRAFVSGRLWPDVSQEHAFGCLRTALWRMNGSGRLLEATSTHLCLVPSIDVDVAELEASAEAVLRRGGVSEAEEGERVLHGEDLLPDWYDEWVLEERERLGQLRVLALEVAADDFIRRRAHNEAVLAATAAVRADPVRESAARLLIRAHLGAGNPAEAVREFHAFRTRLARDIGLDPSRQIVDLLRQQT